MPQTKPSFFSLIFLADSMTERTPAGSVATGFFGEDVLARFDGGGDVHRPEAGRRREDHQVDIGGEHFLVGVEADEAHVILDLELVAERSLERILGTIETILEQVAHGDEFDVVVMEQAVARGAGASSAAADERDAEFFRTGGVDEVGAEGRERRRRADGGGGFEHVASGEAGEKRGESGWPGCMDEFLSLRCVRTAKSLRYPILVYHANSLVL